MSKGRQSVKNLLRSLRKRQTPPPIIIVSGLPRSGTSMMMKMLQAGGIVLLTDRLREADADNPEGYYEFERVKQLDKGDTGWLPEARGRAVKVISPLLQYLPPEEEYRVILMNRRMEEILASQRKMLVRRGEDPDKTSDEKMQELYIKHLAKVRAWLHARPNIQVLETDYNALLAEPLPHVLRVCMFLGGDLSPQAMASVVHPDLYRNRAG
jgi:hypothetical protein